MRGDCSQALCLFDSLKRYQSYNVTMNVCRSPARLITTLLARASHLRHDHANAVKANAPDRGEVRDLCRAADIRVKIAYRLPIRIQQRRFVLESIWLACDRVETNDPV